MSDIRLCWLCLGFGKRPRRHSHTSLFMQKDADLVCVHVVFRGEVLVNSIGQTSGHTNACLDQSSPFHIELLCS